VDRDADPSTAGGTSSREIGAGAAVWIPPGGPAGVDL